MNDSTIKFDTHEAALEYLEKRKKDMPIEARKSSVNGFRTNDTMIIVDEFNVVYTFKANFATKKWEIQ